MITLRPMRTDETELVPALARATFDDLDRRRGRTPQPVSETRRVWFARRTQHLLDTDPERQIVALDGHDLVGAAMATMREGLWALSLLVVRPGTQSTGLGRRLIDAALDRHTGPGAICASDDSRALRRYAAAGFALHPCLEGSGRADLSGAVVDVRVADGVDPDFADAVDRVARGHGHGPDHAFLRERSTTALRYEEGERRGYAYAQDDGHVALVAASEPAVAQALLWAVLARHVETGVDSTVGFVTGGQQWAMDVLVAARLRLTVDGAVCWRGMPEPTAYLPNGALL